MLFQHTWSGDEDVKRRFDSSNIPVEPLRRFPLMGAVGHHHQQVDVAVGGGFPPGGGAEKNDLQGIDQFDNPADQLVDYLSLFIQ